MRVVVKKWYPPYRVALITHDVVPEARWWSFGGWRKQRKRLLISIDHSANLVIAFVLHL